MPLALPFEGNTTVERIGAELIQNGAERDVTLAGENLRAVGETVLDVNVTDIGAKETVERLKIPPCCEIGVHHVPDQTEPRATVERFQNRRKRFRAVEIAVCLEQSGHTVRGGVLGKQGKPLDHALRGGGRIVLRVVAEYADIGRAERGSDQNGGVRLRKGSLPLARIVERGGSADDPGGQPRAIQGGAGLGKTVRRKVGNLAVVDYPADSPEFQTRNPICPRKCKNVGQRPLRTAER